MSAARSSSRLRVRRLVVGALAAALVDVAAGCTAEASPPDAGAGSRIRVTAPSVSGKRLVGTLVGLDAASVTLQRNDGSEPLLVPVGAITRFEVSRRPGRKARGVAIGALVGAVVAVAFGLQTGQDCGALEDGTKGDDFTSRLARNLCFGKGEMAVASAILAVPGGALVGLALAPGEKWETSAPGRLRVAVAPTRGGGLRGSISIAF